MKTELGVSVAVLAASPEPKIKPGPMAMCYKMASPVPVEVRYA